MSAYSEKMLNRLAQYLYEEIGNEPGIQLVMNMTGKPELVAALKRSIERVQADAVRELNEGIEAMRAVWEQMGEQMVQAFADVAEAVAAAEVKTEPTKPDLSRWDVEYKHEDCPQCEALAERAIQSAIERGTSGVTCYDNMLNPGGPKHSGRATRA